MQDSVSNIKLKEAEDFYRDRVMGWMIGDLNKSIDAGTNFLTALGCMVYTEVIGTLLPKIQHERGRTEEKHFYRCFYRLPSGEYLKELDRVIESVTGKKLYGHIRNSMSHTYYPAIKKVQNGNVMFVPSVVARDGIIFDGILKRRSSPIFIDNENRVVVATRNYVDELTSTAEGFYKKAFIEKIDEYQASAIRGVDYIIRGIRG